MKIGILFLFLLPWVLRAQRIIPITGDTIWTGGEDRYFQCEMIATDTVDQSIHFFIKKNVHAILKVFDNGKEITSHRCLLKANERPIYTVLLKSKNRDEKQMVYLESNGFLDSIAFIKGTENQLFSTSKNTGYFQLIKAIKADYELTLFDHRKELIGHFITHQRILDLRALKSGSYFVQYQNHFYPIEIVDPTATKRPIHSTGYNPP